MPSCSTGGVYWHPCNGSLRGLPTKVKDSELSLLLEVLDSGYDQTAWHGPNLKQSLRGVSADEASWRPSSGRHNIWEVAVHTAYWKYIARRRLRREPGRSFAFKGSDWFARPSSGTHGNEKVWREDRQLLEDEHQRLRKAISDLAQERRLGAYLPMIYGVAFHDVYHAGQIRLLRRLRLDSAAAKGRPGRA